MKRKVGRPRKDRPEPKQRTPEEEALNARKGRKPLRKTEGKLHDPESTSLPDGLGPDWDAELKGHIYAKWRIFILEYLRDRNGQRAVVAAGFSEVGKSSTANRLLKDPRVAKIIATHEEALAKKMGIDVAEYASQLHAMATADIRKLVQTQRVPCRYCHSKHTSGTGAPMRQYTPGEYSGAYIRWLKQKSAYDRNKGEGDGDFPGFDGVEGDWYNPTLAINPGCVNCHGEGEFREFYGDVRSLEAGSPELRLFGGVKVGKDGTEVKVHDQMAAFLNFGRVIGAFKDGLGEGQGEAATTADLDRLAKDQAERQKQQTAKVEDRRARRAQKKG